MARFVTIGYEDQAVVSRVSATPCAVAHGVVEVWPVQPPPEHS